MPELPEVQTIVSDLKILTDYRFEAIWTDWPKVLLPEQKIYTRKLIGRKIKGVFRRGKYILVELDHDLILGFHLRMSGRLFIRQPSDLPDPFVHVVFKLSGGKELRFSDMRKFGRVWLFDKKSYQKEMGLEKLGDEPLDSQFTCARFKKIFAKKKGILKSKLLNQSIIAGIGNIYADEICFASGLHPLSRIEKLSDQDLKRIYQNLRTILTYAIEARGSSVGEFKDAFGRTGQMQKRHFAYKRRGLPCKVCKTTLKGIRVAQRGTSFCPKCQLLKDY